jgi:hypothetical protein
MVAPDREMLPVPDTICPPVGRVVGSRENACEALKRSSIIIVDNEKNQSGRVIFPESFLFFMIIPLS